MLATVAGLEARLSASATQFVTGGITPYEGLSKWVDKPRAWVTWDRSTCTTARIALVANACGDAASAREEVTCIVQV